MGPKVLVIRPKEEAYETADLLVMRGYEPIIAPLLHIHYKDVRELLPADGYIVTSQNGVKAFLKLNRNTDTLLYSVGEKTSSLLETHGFQHVHTAEGDGESLVHLIERTTSPDQKLVHLSGAHLAVDIGTCLKEKGFSCDRQIVYETTYSETLPATLLEQLSSGQVQAVLFYSPKSMEVFLATVSNTSALHGICLSEAVAATGATHAWAGIHVATQKTTESMLDQLDQIDFRCHNGNKFQTKTG